MASTAIDPGTIRLARIRRSTFYIVLTEMSAALKALTKLGPQVEPGDERLSDVKIALMRVLRGIERLQQAPAGVSPDELTADGRLVRFDPSCGAAHVWRPGSHTIDVHQPAAGQSTAALLRHPEMFLFSNVPTDCYSMEYGDGTEAPNADDFAAVMNQHLAAAREARL